MDISNIRLGVNIDHVATLRQARGTSYPDPIQAALTAIKAGADGITLHLREDRRHIQDADVYQFKKMLNVPMNLEIAVTDEMLRIAEEVRPDYVCFVPEKREELTTEGGLDVLSHQKTVQAACERMAASGVKVSLFIDPDLAQIDAAKAVGAPVIELHTGTYANAENPAEQLSELDRIKRAAEYAHRLGLIVNAGHGLNEFNVQDIAAIAVMNELNIGHGLIARAVFIGLTEAVAEMKSLMQQARERILAV